MPSALFVQHRVAVLPFLSAGDTLPHKMMAKGSKRGAIALSAPW